MADYKRTPGKKGPAKKVSVAKAAAVTTGEASARDTRRRAAPKAAPAESGELEAISLFDAPVTGKVEAVAAAPKAVVDAAVEAPPATPAATEMIAPTARLVEAGRDQARQAYAQAQATGETFRQALAESANVTTRGALEVNGKVIDALCAQSEAALDLWQSTLSAGSFSEAVRLQATGARQVYETVASHWKDVAETTGRWLGASVKPIQSAWSADRT
jgi:hypothetical protein